MVKDYLGHEINIGDTLMYNQKACKGYYSSFMEGVVVSIIGNGKIEVCKFGNLDGYKQAKKSQVSWLSNYTDNKFGKNTVNLTALNIRERVEVE